MKVAVCGLWHLGTVTAACVAEHFETVAWDPDFTGKLPVDEPGLADLWAKGLASGRLRIAKPRRGDVVWLTFDTPVDDDDKADAGSVAKRFAELDLKPGTLVLISSQVPVGFTAGLEKKYPKLRFAVSPENLRLGAALDAFRKPARIVVGIRDLADRLVLQELMLPFGKVEWMGIESAEMAKHAINAFLGVSVAFANEIATVCEVTGADARDVVRAMRTEPRIGPKAYLSPGAGFSGGTLARDLQALGTPIMKAVLESNRRHLGWAVEKARGLKTIAVLGLTYKVGTDTLRRSLSIEMCKALIKNGSTLRVFDPLVKAAPIDATFCATAEEAIEGADALIVGTPWPQFRHLRVFPPVVIDPDRHLDVPETCTYFAVGKP